MEQTDPVSNTGSPSSPPILKPGGDASPAMPQDTTTQKQSPMLNRPIILGNLTLASPTTQATIGANGSASAMPTPLGYLLINVGNSTVAVAYFNPS